MKILNNPNLPQHNQGTIEEFVEKDITSGKPYFCFLKKNNGENHILSNIFDDKNLKLIMKEFIRTMINWEKEMNRR